MGCSGMVDCGAGVRLERGLRCRMTDGVELVADQYLPGPAHGRGPWPTLLMRQPYGRDIASTVVYAHPVWWASRGYHVVIQDVRGRGDSGGDFYAFRNEGRDGAETIGWVRGLAASNGKVGMYGFSYQGATQLLAAAEQPEGLMCIAPHMAAVDLYHGWMYHQGALRLGSALGWGIQMLREDARRRGLRAASDRLEAAWARMREQPLTVPYGSHAAIADPELPGYVRDWMSHRMPDGDGQRFWSELDVSTRLDRIQVPALHVAGWYDLYLAGSVAGYLALRAGAGSEFARENQYLLAGPWVHIPWGDRVGDRDLGAAANLDTDGLLLKWFDHWLKDGKRWDEPRVKHFALGENRWHEAQEWPAAGEVSLYLHSAGRANSRKGDGRLAAGKPAGEEPRDEFVYDPEVPVMGPGGVDGLNGPRDQAAMELGNNLLVYRTAELGGRVHVFGTPRVRLWAATSAGSADFTAKLVRGMAGGRVEFVSIGIARSSWLFREGYEADRVQCWEFELKPTSLVLGEEEWIGLEVASSAFPLYDRNPSTGVSAELADNWNWARSTQQVAHTAEWPSALLLPVLEGGEWLK